MSTSAAANEQTVFTLHTLHRGRLIQILLSSLFTIGITVSLSGIGEISKIIILLICLPLLLFLSVKFSQQPSQWSVDDQSLMVVKGSKRWVFPFAELTYVQNHIRSGGNLIAVHKKGAFQPVRFWRNKLFQSVDEFDELMQHLQKIQVPITFG